MQSLLLHQTEHYEAHAARASTLLTMESGLVGGCTIVTG